MIMRRPERLMWESDDDLRHWLLETVDGLQEAWTKRDLVGLAYILLNWLGCHGTFSHKHLLLDHRGLSVQQLLSKMLSYEGGVWCGGMATCFTELLYCFPGVYAAKWSYGLHEQNISHVTTLLGRRDGKAFVFDCYLGYTYKDATTGEAFEFSDLLCAIRDKDYERIERVDIGLRRPAVAIVGDIGNRFNWCFGGQPPAPEKYEDRWVYQGAETSCDNLFAPGTHNRNRIDAARGDVPFEHFMYDLILEETRISRWVPRESREIPSTSFSLMRRLIQRLVK